MKPTTTLKRVTGAFILTLTLAFAGSLQAQGDSLIALGIVNSNGTLVNSTNRVGGTVSTTRNSEGDYDIDVDAAGAFAGSADDYVLIVTKRTSDSDNYVYGKVTSVGPNQLTAKVKAQDLEDDANKNAQLLADTPFNFVIRKLDPVTSEVASGSRHLLALGRVSSGGSLTSGFGVNDVAVSSSGAGGNYSVTLAKNGAFTGLTDDDFVSLLLVRDGNLVDNIATTSSIVVSDDQVVFNIRIHDVQDGGNGLGGTLEADEFFFTFFQIPPTPTDGRPNSRLLIAAANVTAAGNLVEGGSSLPNSVVSSSDTATGIYEVDINAAGAFAGKSSEQYIVMATIRESGNTDRTVSASATIQNDNTLRVFVSTQDVENDGDLNGDLEDEDFAIVVYDSGATFQPDMRIGKKRSLTKMKGDDRYNSSGGGQGIKIGLSSSGRNNFFFAAQNDGTSVDNFRIKEKGAGKIVNIKYFRLSDGRKNVTAAIRKGKTAVSEVAPGKPILFQAQARYRSSLKTPKRNVRLIATSDFGGTKDTARAKTVSE